nr:MAG TPA_asm: hypothetical protein [Caudoviricetes sp.]
MVYNSNVLNVWSAVRVLPSCAWSGIMVSVARGTAPASPNKGDSNER